MFEIIFLICGFFMGSFLNNITYHGSIRSYFSSSHSVCLHCEKDLSLIGLIPVFSYIVQSEKCKACSKKISTLHFYSELFCGVLYLFVYLAFGLSIQLIYVIGFVSLLFTLSLTDIYYYLLPNYLVSSLFLLIIIWSQKLNMISIKESVFSVAFSFLLLSFIIYFTDGGMGIGDLKLLSVLAYLFGIKKYLILINLSSFLGLLYFIYLKRIAKKRKEEKINEQLIFFGPFISIAAVLILFLLQLNIL